MDVLLYLLEMSSGYLLHLLEVLSVWSVIKPMMNPVGGPLLHQSCYTSTQYTMIDSINL